MSVRSQIEAMNGPLVENARDFATSVVIDDLQGHVWSGNGVYWHFEQSVNGEGMPVMLLSSTVILRVSSVFSFFGGPPQQRWKITAVDITGAAVTGYINEVTPDLDRGQYIVRFGK